MEADSLAQSVEMSAVPWPLLKLCFSVISNLQEIVVLSETARKDLSHSWCGNHFESEMSQPVHTFSPTVMQCSFCQWTVMTLIRDLLQTQKKKKNIPHQLISCLSFPHQHVLVNQIVLWLNYNNLSRFNNHYGFLNFILGSDDHNHNRFLPCYTNWL